MSDSEFVASLVRATCKPCPMCHGAGILTSYRSPGGVVCVWCDGSGTYPATKEMTAAARSRATLAKDPRQ